MKIDIKIDNQARGSSAAAWQARGPSAAARQARWSSAAARQAVYLPLNPMLTSSSPNE